MATVIPEMTHPLSNLWSQPATDKIVLGKETCMMTEAIFNQLKEYSTTIPTGVYSGKMWRRQHKQNEWYLCWYGWEENNEKGEEVCPVHFRKIDIVDSIPTVKQ